jgi:hypothetical protein
MACRTVAGGEVTVCCFQKTLHAALKTMTCNTKYQVPDAAQGAAAWASRKGSLAEALPLQEADPAALEDTTRDLGEKCFVLLLGSIASDYYLRF